MTGLSLSVGPGIYGKQIELLNEIVPKLNRVAALSNSLNPANAVQLKETQSAAVALGVTLLSFDVKGPDDLDAVFTAIKKERAEALVVLADPVLLGQRRRIADLAVKSGLPSIYGIPEHVEAGASWVMRRTVSTSSVAQPLTWTKFSKAPSLPTFLSSSRPSSTW